MRMALPLTGRKIVIAYNPTAGSGDRQQRIDALVSKLFQADFEVVLCSHPDMLVEEVTQIATAGDLRGVITAGGDGTVALAINRLPAGIPLAIFPLGTENLLSRYLEHTADAERITALFREGKIAKLDAATANGRLFSLMASCGFDAEVVRRTHAARRGNIRHWSYIKPILTSLRTYNRPEMKVTIQHANTSETFVCRWAFITNIPRYAGGLRFNPQAHSHDGLLDICLLKHGSIISGLRYLAGVAMGWHTSWSDVTLRQGTTIRIDSEEHVPYQLDGDPGGELPLEVHCLPERLSVIVTETWAKEQGFVFYEAD